MIKKNFFKYLAVLFVLATLVVPRVAHAATAAEVQDIAEKAFRLCVSDPERYKGSCEVADRFNTIAKAAAKKPEKEQATFINVSIPNFASTQTTINKNYLKAVTDGRVNSEGGATVGSNYSGADDCGGVAVSVDVGCSGKGNPIYDYLRGIIIFIGAAIGLAVVISIIVAGIQYSSSAGNPQNIAKAKERIVNAVIGLLLYLFLAAIIRYLIPQVFS
jgi:hypothetical protein